MPHQVGDLLFIQSDAELAQFIARACDQIKGRLPTSQRVRAISLAKVCQSKLMFVR
jgi:hypothetical protein